MDSRPPDGLPVYHLIYSSSAVVRLTQRELLELLTISRQKNEARELTGMLLYRDGVYLQYLEGPANEVIKLLTRLRQDDRHTSIRILRQGVLPRTPLSGLVDGLQKLVGFASGGRSRLLGTSPEQLFS